MFCKEQVSQGSMFDFAAFFDHFDGGHCAVLTEYKALPLVKAIREVDRKFVEAKGYRDARSFLLDGQGKSCRTAPDTSQAVNTTRPSQGDPHQQMVDLPRGTELRGPLGAGFSASGANVTQMVQTAMKAPPSSAEGGFARSPLPNPEGSSLEEVINDNGHSQAPQDWPYIKQDPDRVASSSYASCSGPITKHEPDRPSADDHCDSRD